MQTVQGLLDELYQVREERTVFLEEANEKRRIILRPVQEEIDSIDSAYGDLMLASAERESRLVEGIKESVLSTCASAKGSKLHALYVKGRKSWDTDKLEGLAAAHPEILQFQKVGEPSVTIRSAK
jgi:hypothetical protein